MLIGMRNAMLAGGAALPYDKRVQYIESTNGAAYFYLNDALPNLTETPSSFDSAWVDMWEVVLGVAQVNSTDKHLFGKSYSFGLAQYNGKWRPSYTQDWPTNQNIPMSSYNPVMFRAETGRMRVFTADGTTQIWQRTGDLFIRFGTDKSQWPGRLIVGAMEDDSAIAPVSKRATNRIYSFRRVLQNQPEFTLVPCVKDGVAGMYDEVSGIFCASRSGTPFVAGPDASAANGGGGISANA